MADPEYANRLALLAAYGPPEQQARAREALQRLANDQETDADPAEDLGVQNDATKEELYAAGVTYHGSVLLMEIDAARVDQDAHNTMELVKREQPIRTCARRMLFLRETLLNACKEQQPLKPWFYHGLLTLAYIRRNARVLRRKRGAPQFVHVIPACSADQESDTCYDDYDLIDELNDCSCCVKNVWDQLMTFLERMRMREFELQPLDEQERKWCSEHDAELRQIFLYLRGELRATNPMEYRAVWELFQTEQLDLVMMRRLWRGVKPHILSRARAVTLLSMIASGHLNQAGLSVMFHKEILDVKVVVGKALYAIKLNKWESISSSNANQDEMKHFAELFEDPAATIIPSALAQVEELYATVQVALQALWTACVRERIAGNQLKALELVLRRCMGDRDAVLKLVRDCNIALRVTEVVRLRLQTAAELTTAYSAAWHIIQDLEDVRPKVGARYMAFSVWSIIRQSAKYQVRKTVVSQSAGATVKDADGNDTLPTTALFANEREALERSFLIVRCLGRHPLLMRLVADAFVCQTLEGHWEVLDKEGIGRGQDYVRWIMKHEEWVEKYKHVGKTDPSTDTTMSAALNGTLADVVQGRDGVCRVQCERRLTKIKDNPVAREVFHMTEENRTDTKIRWLIFALLIIPYSEIQKLLSRAHYVRWLELYKVYCEEHAQNPERPVAHA